MAGNRDYCISPVEEQRLISRAKELLTKKNWGTTKYLRDRLDITGARAGMIFRAMGWIRYNSDSRTVRYRRPEE